MSDRSLTLLAVHLDDTQVQIGPKGTDQSRSDSDPSQSGDPLKDAENDGLGPLGPLIATVLTLVMVATVLGRVRSRRDDTAVEPEPGE